MSTRNSRPAVQNSYPSARVAGFPGQLADMRSVSRDPHGSYVCETDVYVGRAVVKGTVNVDEYSLRPYSIKAPLADTTAVQLVGLVAYTYAAEMDARGWAFLGEKMLVGVVEPGLDVLVYVNKPEDVTITHGDRVFVAINPDNEAQLPVGLLTNVAGDGLLEWPGVTWHKQVGPQLAVINL